MLPTWCDFCAGTYPSAGGCPRRRHSPVGSGAGGLGGCSLRSKHGCLTSPHPAVRQYADICLFSTAQYKCPVAQIEQE